MLRTRPRQMKKDTKSWKKEGGGGREVSSIRSEAPSFSLGQRTHDCSIPGYQDDDIPSPLTPRTPRLTDETPSGSSDGDESEDWRERGGVSESGGRGEGRDLLELTD